MKCESCGSDVETYIEWKHPARWCDDCKKKGIGRTDWRTKYNEVPGVGTDKKGQFEKPFPQQNIRDLDTEDHTYYDPNNNRSGTAPGNRGEK